MFILDGCVFMLLVLFHHSSVSAHGATTSNILQTNSSVFCVKSHYVTPDINVICNCSVGWNDNAPDIPLIVRWEVIENSTTTTVTFCYYIKPAQNGTTQNSANGSQPIQASPDMCIMQNPMTLALPTLKVKDKGLSGHNITCTYETNKGQNVQVGDYTPHLVYGPDDVKLTSPNNKYRPEKGDTMTLVCKAKGMPTPTFTWEGHPDKATIMRHCVVDTTVNDLYDSTLTFSHADLVEGHLINCTVTVEVEDWTNSTTKTFVLKDPPNHMLSAENIALYVSIAGAFLLGAGFAVVVTKSCQCAKTMRDRRTADAEEARPTTSNSSNPPQDQSLERSLPRNIPGADGEPHTSRSRSAVSEQERSRSEVREHHSLPTPTPVSEYNLPCNGEGPTEVSINQETHTSPGLGESTDNQTPPETAIFTAGDDQTFEKLRDPEDPIPSPSIHVHGQPGLDNIPPQSRPDEAFQPTDDLDPDNDDQRPVLQDP